MAAIAAPFDDERPTRRLGAVTPAERRAWLARLGIAAQPLSQAARAILARYDLGEEPDPLQQLADWLDHGDAMLEPEPPEPTDEEWETYRRELVERQRG